MWHQCFCKQNFEILRHLQIPGILKISHTFLMKNSDLAPKTGQNDTQLFMFSTKFHVFRVFYMDILKEGSHNFPGSVQMEDGWQSEVMSLMDLARNQGFEILISEF